MAVRSAILIATRRMLTDHAQSTTELVLALPESDTFMIDGSGVFRSRVMETSGQKGVKQRQVGVVKSSIDSLYKNGGTVTTE